MARYIGLTAQQRRNNFRSVLLLILFPVILAGINWLICWGLNEWGYDTYEYDAYGNITNYYNNAPGTMELFYSSIPWVIGCVLIWFIIAYFANVSMIRHSTGAKPLERKENPRVYNLVENLCMSCGMKTPQINIVNDPQLNAFASGIDDRSYTVTLTTGIINVLNDEELEGVIAHELTHIRNRDVRLMIVSIVFVGILATLMQIAVIGLRYVVLFGGSRSSNSKQGGCALGLVVMAILLVASAIGYFFSMLARLAISRKREFMADAGGAELTKNPLALASALRKISNNPGLADIKREDVAQLFIFHTKLKGGVFSSLFSTHPDVNERIRILEQF